MDKKEAYIVRELAKEYAEVAALPVQEEKKSLWRKLNAKKPERPMVAIDSICWNELNVNDELTLRCDNPDVRKWEDFFRKTLYQWRRFPCDMVVNNYLTVTKAAHGVRFELPTEEDTIITDPQNDVYSHAYKNQIRTMEDLEKVKTPTVWHDEAETARQLNLAKELFDGIIEVRVNGVTPYMSVWDPIATWMGMENVYIALIDNPDMMHELVNRMVAGYMSIHSQMEELGLLEHTQPLIQRTGAWTDDLPAEGFDPCKPRLRDIWGFGLAQTLSLCSPAMFDEYEIEPNLKLFERFGLMFYGCCEPLDGKMASVRKIPNVRKVSMSPWTNKARGAAEIGRDYVFSNRPNPGFLVAFDEDVIRKDMMETKKICESEGCPLEFIIRDIGTVNYEPQRIWRCEQIAMEVAGA